MKFTDERVLVVGLGTSGFAAARALLSAGARVRVTDAASSPAIEDRAAALRAAGVEVETGSHGATNADVDLAVVSPGIPPTSPVAAALRGAGVPVISEVELAWQLAGGEFLAVTGTNGKTTTTSLLTAMLTQAGVATIAAGNIGLPVVDAIFQVPSDGAIVLEVSSFQLATIVDFRPRVAVLLNIAQDHMDWHGTVDDYARAKARIIENQTADDVFVPNYEDRACMDIAARARGRVVPFSALQPLESGVGVVGGSLVWRGSEVLPVDAVPLPGQSGLEDVAAAAAAALEYGIDVRAIGRAIRSFRPLAHRCEIVAQAAGVTWIDDSKATNPHATIHAVKGFRDVVLIAGGRSKGIDLSALAATAPPVVAVVAMGEAGDEIEKIFTGLVPVERADSMDSAVERAARHARPGGSVFLSPGCASLDMYTSYVQRGEDFARAVRELIDRP